MRDLKVPCKGARCERDGCGHERKSAMASEVESQVTGKVWKIEKEVGASVERGEVILIIESMKMEIPVEAPCAGMLREIRVEEGEAVEEFDVLALID